MAPIGDEARFVGMRKTPHWNCRCGRGAIWACREFCPEPGCTLAAPRKVVLAHRAAEEQRLRVPNAQNGASKPRGKWAKPPPPPPSENEMRLQAQVAKLQAQLSTTSVPEDAPPAAASATPPSTLRDHIAKLEKQIKGRSKDDAFDRELNRQDEEHIERIRLQLSAVQSPQALHSAASQDFNKKQAALRRVTETLEAKEAALAKMQNAISQLREQQAAAQAELRAAQQKLSATNFAVTGGPLAIPKLDERFAVDQPDLQKWLADPCFKLWQEALEKQARDVQEAERAQAAKDAAKAATDGASTHAPISGSDAGAAGGVVGDPPPVPDCEFDAFMDLDEDLLADLRAAASSSDKRAFAELIGQQGIVKKQRQG